MAPKAPKPPKPLKERAEKVKEAIEILKSLKNVGADKDSGFVDVKRILDEWIAGSETFHGRVDFPRYGRYAELLLPVRADRKSTCVLRAGEELKAQVAEREQHDE